MQDTAQVNWGVPLEVVAAISAVVSVVMNTSPGGFAITSIAPEAAPAPAGAANAWAKAGVIDQHITRRSVYLWGRR